MGEDFFHDQSKTVQKRGFTPEGLSALQREFPLFQSILNTQRNLIADALGPQAAVGAGARGGARLANTVTSGAGQDAGLNARSLADIFASLPVDNPLFLNLISQLAQQLSGSVQALVDPRLAIGLRPSIDSEGKTVPSPYSLVNSGIQTAGSFGGCWIALAIYGPYDPRFYLARRWVNGPLRRTWFGRKVYAAYMRYGPRLGRYPRICRLLRPVFERAWRGGLQDVMQEVCDGESA